MQLYSGCIDKDKDLRLGLRSATFISWPTLAHPMSEVAAPSPSSSHQLSSSSAAPIARGPYAYLFVPLVFLIFSTTLVLCPFYCSWPGQHQSPRHGCILAFCSGRFIFVSFLFWSLMPESCLIFRRWNTIDGGATTAAAGVPRGRRCFLVFAVTVFHTLA